MRKVAWSIPEFSDEDKQAMKDVIDSEWLSEGKVTEEFEQALQDYLGCRHVITFNSATSALSTALLAHGIKTDDEVLIPSYGFIATMNTTLGARGKPVLVDSDLETLNITPELAAKQLTGRSKAVMPIDVAGMPIDPKAFEDFAEENNLVFIEDAAEALGSEYRHKKVGCFDHTAIFSFHIAKTITSVEGGCITTNDDEVALKCRMIKNHGVHNKTRTAFDYFGFNYRTTDLNSALGLSQLKRIDKFLDHRNKIARLYLEELEGLVGFQKVPEYVTRHSWMFFPIKVEAEKRDEINAYLNEHGVATRICWLPVHQQKFHKGLFPSANLPNAELLGKTNLTIPMGNNMSLEDAQYVADTVKAAVRKCRP